MPELKLNGHALDSFQFEAIWKTTLGGMPRLTACVLHVANNEIRFLDDLAPVASRDLTTLRLDLSNNALHPDAVVQGLLATILGGLTSLRTLHLDLNGDRRDVRMPRVWLGIAPRAIPWEAASADPWVPTWPTPPIGTAWCAGIWVSWMWNWSAREC